MKKCLLFIGALVAGLILITNIGPLVLLALSVWLLYIIFKQFVKSDSTTAKILWFIIGLAVLALGLSNIYAVLGIAAAYVLYIIFKNWHDGSDEIQFNPNKEEPFSSFDRQWGEFYKN